jgi:hypothetical protein
MAKVPKSSSISFVAGSIYNECFAIRIFFDFYVLSSSGKMNSEFPGSKGIL